MLGRTGPEKAVVLFWTQVLPVRTKLVVTSWGISDIHVGLTTFAWLLKRAPFLVETDSMSVKYINNMKSSRGVHARWAELIGSYSFTITHARVIVEDCVSRCPAHLPEPTQKELDMEKD